MRIADWIEDLLGPDLPIRFEAYDGSATGAPDAPATVEVRSPDALNRVVFAPSGEIGFARAYVAGDLVLHGDINALFQVRDRLPDVTVRPRQVLELARILGRNARRLPPPPEEARGTGRLHSPLRDRKAVSHHYDVSNRFYELVLDPSMTYSCAVFENPDDDLHTAQAAKHELTLRKLALEPGMRHLDIGCGWGAHVIHAARHFGVRSVGVTLSQAQYDLARKKVAEAGLSDMVEIRLQDYRDIDDGPYDAISSIGMFEHVGIDNTGVFLDKMHDLLVPGGRAVLHSITTRRPSKPPWFRPDFIRAYIFPDGELQPVGDITDAMQLHGFDVQHVESLSQHYGPTLHRWHHNMEQNWDEAVAEVGDNRARLWRLYLAGGAFNFDEGRILVHQVLATRSHEGGHHSFPFRPDWDPSHLQRFGG